VYLTAHCSNWLLDQFLTSRWNSVWSFENILMNFTLFRGQTLWLLHNRWSRLNFLVWWQRIRSCIWTVWLCWSLYDTWRCCLLVKSVLFDIAIWVELHFEWGSSRINYWAPISLFGVHQLILELPHSKWSSTQIAISKSMDLTSI
jgi:hypothetical protein